MRFSDRTSFAGTAPNALSLLWEAKKKNGEVLWDLTQSNPTRCGFQNNGGATPATNASAGRHGSPLHEPFTDPRNLVYEPDPRGLPEARAAVSAYYASKNIRINPDQVFLTSSTSEAYTYLFHLLADPGDTIAYAKPAYPLFDSLANLSGVKLEGFRSDGALPDGTKALLLVNPNNPTGRYVSDWERVRSVCREHSLALISDEVFFDFDWQEPCLPAGRRARVSAASFSDVLSFTMSGVSKVLGLPQMKLSWIVVGGPERPCRAACEKLEVIADTFLSVNTPSQRALRGWFEHKDAFVAEVMDRLRSNFKILQDVFVGAQHAAPLHEPEGGWHTILPLPERLSDEEAALHLLRTKNVLVHPGYFFDLEENGLVLSLMPEEGPFRTAARRLGEALREL